MAKKVISYLTDDMEEGEEVRAVTTLEFCWDGEWREIDLGTRNLTKVNAQMAPLLAHSRKVSRKRGGQVRTVNPTNGSRGDKTRQDTAIRVWALTQGIPIKSRGAIPRDVRKAFEEAHSGPVAPETPRTLE